MKRKLLSPLLLTLVVLIGTILAYHVLWQAPSLVRETQFGQVRGAVSDDVLSWKGVSYGGSTAGKQRFKAPTNPDKWSGQRDATQAGQVASQASSDGVIGGEDVLNLDIYRPNSHADKLPVIVYIHGGNNQTGNAQELSGASFVKTHDAIFVSVNYRLGALGFNPLPALKTGTDEENSGNYALLDMAKSLDWVRANIENFGGDSQNITVAGFSAGGRDVMAMLISPIFKGKFDRAISFSGGMTLADEAASQDVFAQALAPLVVEDGLQADEAAAKTWLLSTDSAVKDYLENISAERLAPLMSNASIRMAVFPHLYKDGTVIPEEGFDTTSYNDVPLLLLTGEREFSLFGYYDRYFAQAQADGTMTQEPASGDYAYINRYGGKLYAYANTQASAEKLAPRYQSSIYTTSVQFGDDESLVGQPMATFGSFHGVFVPFLDKDNQNYAALVGKAYKSQGAQALGNLFQDYIYHFMQNGNPNGKGLPNWQAWTASGDSNTLYLTASQDKASATMGTFTDNYDSILAEMAADSSISDERKQTLNTQVLNGRWFSYQLDAANNNLSAFSQANGQ